MSPNMPAKTQRTTPSAAVISKSFSMVYAGE